MEINTFLAVNSDVATILLTLFSVSPESYTPHSNLKKCLHNLWARLVMRGWHFGWDLTSISCFGLENLLDSAASPRFIQDRKFRRDFDLG